MTHRLLKLFCALLFTAWAPASFAMFISPDPLDPTTPGVGTNRYAYSGGDPINHADPSGHAWVDRTWDGAFGEGSFDRTFGNGASERMDRVADSLFGDSHDRAAASAYGGYSRGGGSLGYDAWRDATQNYTLSFARDYLAGGAEVGAFTPRSGPGAETRTLHVGGFLDNITPNSPVKGQGYAPFYTWGDKGRLARDVLACAGSSGCNARIAGHSMGGHTVGTVVGAMPPGSATGLMIDPVPVFTRSPIPGNPNLTRIYAVPFNRNFLISSPI